MEPVTVNIGLTSLASAANAGLTPKSGDPFGSLLLALQLNPPEATTGTALQVPLMTSCTAGATSRKLQDGTLDPGNSPTAESEQDNPGELSANDAVSQATPTTTVRTQPSALTAWVGSATSQHAAAPAYKASMAHSEHGNSSEFRPTNAAQETPITIPTRAATADPMAGRDNPATPAARAPAITAAFSAATGETPSAARGGKPSAGEKGKKSSPDYPAADVNQVAARSNPIQQLDLRHLVPASPAQPETTPSGLSEPSIAANSRAATGPDTGTSLLAGAGLFPAGTVSFSNGKLSNGNHPASPAQVRVPNDSGAVLESPVAIQSRSNQSPPQAIERPSLHDDPRPSTAVSSAAAPGPSEFEAAPQVSRIAAGPHRVGEIALTARGNPTPEIEQKPVRGLQQTEDRPALQRAKDQPPLPAPAISAAAPPEMFSEGEVTFAADITANQSPTAKAPANDFHCAMTSAISSDSVRRSSPAKDTMEAPQPSLGTSDTVTPNWMEGMNSAASGGGLYRDLDIPAAAEMDQPSPPPSGSIPSIGAAEDPGDRSQPVAPSADLPSGAVRAPHQSSVTNQGLRVTIAGRETLNGMGSAKFFDRLDARDAETRPASGRGTAPAAATGTETRPASGPAAARGSQSGSETEPEVKSNGGKAVASPTVTAANPQDVPQGAGDTTLSSSPAIPPIELIIGAQREISAATAVAALGPDDPKVAPQMPGKASSQDQQKVSRPQSRGTESSSDSADDLQHAPVGSPEALTPQANPTRNHDAAIPVQGQPQPTAATADRASEALSAAVSQAQTQVTSSRSVPDGKGANTPGPAPGAAASSEPNPPVPAAAVVQTARVLERLGQTEMRIGVSAGDFGSVEVRASVTQDRLSATIAANHQELRTAMMAEMPSLERAMEQHHLRLEQFDLSAQVGSRNGGSSPQQQTSLRSGPQAGFHAGRTDALSAERDQPLPASGVEFGSSRLNVHA